eukprot:313247-Pelagomonas_calceolata.AAC.7
MPALLSDTSTLACVHYLVMPPLSPPSDKMRIACARVEHQLTVYVRPINNSRGADEERASPSPHSPQTLGEAGPEAGEDRRPASQARPKGSKARPRA